MHEVAVHLLYQDTFLGLADKQHVATASQIRKDHLEGLVCGVRHEVRSRYCDNLQLLAS